MSTLVRPIKAQPRLIIAVLLGGLLYFVLPGRQADAPAGWPGIVSTGLYLVLVLAMMARSNIDRIRWPGRPAG